MAKRTDWTYLIGLLCVLGILALIVANTAMMIRGISGHVVLSRTFIIAIVIGLGANLTGLYLLKKKKY